MGFCKLHGELPDTDFIKRSTGYTPPLCKECEREQARNRRKVLYADVAGKARIQAQNATWKRSNAKKVSQKNYSYYLASKAVPQFDISTFLATFREGGYLPPNEDTNIIYNKLFSVPIRDPLPQSYSGLNYLDNSFPHRFKSKTSGFRSFHDCFYDDQEILKIIKYILSTNRIPTLELVIRNLKFNIETPSHFFPEAASALFQTYAVGSDVFDPFLGWGGRALGAICSNVRSYTGTDLQLESVDSCNKVKLDFSHLSAVPTEFIYADAIKFMGDTPRTFDFICTSPPFVDTEDYGHGTNRTSREWAQEIAIPLAKLSLRILRSGGKIAIHAQDRPKMPVLSVITASFSSGFELETEYRYGKRKGQSVLIFKARP